MALKDAVTRSSLHPFPSHCRQKQCHLPERKQAIKTPLGLPIQSFPIHTRNGQAPSHPEPQSRRSGAYMSDFSQVEHRNCFSISTKLFFSLFFFPSNRLSVSYILQTSDRVFKMSDDKMANILIKCPIVLKILCDCIFKKLIRWIFFLFFSSFFKQMLCFYGSTILLLYSIDKRRYTCTIKSTLHEASHSCFMVHFSPIVLESCHRCVVMCWGGGHLKDQFNKMV